MKTTGARKHKNFRLSDETIQRLQQVGAWRGITMTEVIERAVKAHHADAQRKRNGKRKSK